ncbi:MAG: undecaprenyl-diphosphatase [Gammaproteobacteria bacterium]|nr:MAG: undecaprenyl-diphosphatase [Gammaproteobacteria bacterium]
MAQLDIGQALILALVQGLTEFLPISSSAHLILVPILLGWSDQGLAFDVAVHVGTLAAVLWYFRHDIRPLWHGWWESITRRQMSHEGRLAWAILLGTIPVGLVGLLAGNWIELNLRSTFVIAVTTIGFGLLLGWADWRHRGERSEYQLRWKDVAVIGLAQALALIPGTSRSGITITAGLMTGLSREGSARFAFLLSIPTIFLAGGLKGIDLLSQGAPVQVDMLLIGIVVSAVSAYLCIAAFIRLLGFVGMLPFVIYRLLLGLFLLALPSFS